MPPDSVLPPRVFDFFLNGRSVSVEAASPQTTLLDYIRDCGLTGAKEGCAEGECGACTVVLVKPNGQGSEYRPVNSCLMFLPMAAGQEIYTVEALAAKGELHAVQGAMVEAAGSQCGYCTPGFVMSLFAEYYRPARKGACDPEAMGGNLCRCTGYRPIRDAALALGPAADDDFARRLDRPAPAVHEMRYAHQGACFSRPATLAACFAELRDDPEARPVAGGTDLAVESNLRGAGFPHLVSLEAVPELRVFAEREDSVEIGAGLALGEIATSWSSAPPVFHEWLELFASPTIRNRATLGGNLVTASPIGDGAPLLLALDAQVRIAGLDGERLEPLTDFFAGYRKTTMKPGEVLVSILIPKPYPTLARFYKAAKRKLDDISTVACGLAVTIEGGRVRAARLAYGGVAETPTRVFAAEKALEGRMWGAATASEAGHEVFRSLNPISDHRGSADYRLAMARSLVEKFAYQTRAEAA